MSRLREIWTLGVGWLLIATSLFIALDGASFRNWWLLAFTALVLPLLFFAMSKNAPAPSIAKILHETEGRR